MTLATFENAHHVAMMMNDVDGRDYVVIKTNDPHQPYKVEPEDGQADAIVLVTSNEIRTRNWLARRVKPS